MTAPYLIEELVGGAVLIPKPIMDRAPYVGPAFQCCRALSNARVVTESNSPIVCLVEVPALVANITGNHTTAIGIRATACVAAWAVVYCDGGP